MWLQSIWRQLGLDHVVLCGYCLVYSLSDCALLADNIQTDEVKSSSFANKWTMLARTQTSTALQFETWCHMDMCQCAYTTNPHWPLFRSELSLGLVVMSTITTCKHVSAYSQSKCGNDIFEIVLLRIGMVPMWFKCSMYMYMHIIDAF